MAERHVSRDELVKLWKDIAGTQVAEVIEQQMAKVTDRLSAQQTDWMKTIMRGGEGPTPHPEDQDLSVVPPALDPRTGKPERYAGLAQWVGCIVLARNDRERCVRIARLEFKNEPLAKWFETGEQTYRGKIGKQLGTDVGTAGGFIVPPQFSQDIVELLYPQSVVRAAGPMTIPMPTGTVRIPRLTGGSTATYIGENTNIPVSQQQFGQLVLTFKKLVAMVPMSMDLVRYASPSVDAIVRNDIVRQIAAAENAVFLRGDGLASTPRGIRNWANAANVLPSTGAWTAAAPADTTNMMGDIGQCLLALINNNVPITRGAWFMAPSSWWRFMRTVTTTGMFVFRDEMLRGTLAGYPYFRSTQIPRTLGTGTQTELMFVDMADIVIGEAQALIVDASTEAAYVDSAGTLVSGYGQDQMLIRAIAEHDLAARRDVSIAVITGVTD